MKTYALTSASRPTNMSRRQAEAVYGSLEPYGSAQTMDGLIAKAKASHYEHLFKRPHSATIPGSLAYHLNRFKKFGWIRVVDDSRLKR